MTGTRAVIAAAGVALVLGVAACSSDDPEPRIAPTPSESATASTGTAAPVGDSQKSFVRDYFDAIGRATQTGDTTKFMAVSSRSCVNCRVLAQNIQKAFAGDRRVEGADWSVIRTRSVGDRPEGAVWNVDVKTAEERWYGSSGDLLKTVRASTQHFAVIVETRASAFRIADMRLRS